MFHNRGFGGRTQSHRSEGGRPRLVVLWVCKVVGLREGLTRRGNSMEELRRPSEWLSVFPSKPVGPASLHPAPSRPAPGVVVKGTGRQRDKPFRARAEGRISLPAARSRDQPVVAWVSAVSYSPQPLRSSTCPVPVLRAVTHRDRAIGLPASSSPGAACLSASRLAPEQWGICHLIGCGAVSITERPSLSRGALCRTTITSGVGRARGCWPEREQAACAGG